MTRAVIAWVLLACVGVGCRAADVPKAGPAPRTLPYYDSADFTPRWEVAHDASFHRIRPFRLSDQQGQAFTEAGLEGRIAVVDFFFTTCPAICPLMAVSMKTLQREFLDDDRVLLLSHSVTPDTDTTAVLSDYAATHGVEYRRWKLLTGAKSEVYDLGRRYYFVDEDLGGTRNEDEFLHTENFVLIDTARRIRGIYNGLDPDSIRSLIADIRALQAEVYGSTTTVTVAGTALALRSPHFAMSPVDARVFSAAALVRPPEVVRCVLENGASSQCLQVVVKSLPDSMKTGPFCPPTVNDIGGVWDWDGTGAGLYRVDGSFLRMLNGQGYQFYDADGTVHVADLSKGPPAHRNACLAVSLDSAVTMTVLLPQTPVMAARPTRLGTVSKVGLALDGVPIFSDAPSVLHTGHMPALDVCGGHVDPGGWYHWHATSTDINTVFDRAKVSAACGRPQASGALFGYAFDGVPLYGSTDMNGAAPTGLDGCRGHVGPTREAPGGSYHYHSSLDFPNLPPCLSGVAARNNFVTTARAGIGSAAAGGGPGRGRGGPPPPGGRRPGGPPPGFAEAASTLGVTEQALFGAVEANGGRNLDFAEAARALGVSEAALRAALPPPPR